MCVCGLYYPIYENNAQQRQTTVRSQGSNTAFLGSEIIEHFIILLMTLLHNNEFIQFTFEYILFIEMTNLYVMKN